MSAEPLCFLIKKHPGEDFFEFFSSLVHMARGRPPSKALTCTHVIQGLVLRLRLWDLFRWMLAVNSTVLSDDLGLKQFNAQE